MTARIRITDPQSFSLAIVVLNAFVRAKQVRIVPRAMHDANDSRGSFDFEEREIGAMHTSPDGAAACGDGDRIPGRLRGETLTAAE